MRFLRKKFFLDDVELFGNPLDLLPPRRTLLWIQRHCLRPAQPPL